ncbi:hypothetical protein A2Z22_00690 [Candidatus Woesebacteria bacterium RBG_16_34_12]|uniref:Uncharacterized protein n=1 Tax=Candidatus Woesebacteria bacterium RBG_16_34_12 TaxID=1802480 RepID=A0A1F7X8C2_9BACT|nr:MAG: hypothetical protein A2Z22_00690 [Candidatus Woesebacteria bacterium RBG_16_34_12]
MRISKLIRRRKTSQGGHFEDALRIFDYALKLDEKNEQLWEYKSAALNELDRIDEAYECMWSIAKINPEKEKMLAEARKNPEIERCDKLMEDAQSTPA